MFGGYFTRGRLVAQACLSRLAISRAEVVLNEVPSPECNLQSVAVSRCIRHSGTIWEVPRIMKIQPGGLSAIHVDHERPHYRLSGPQTDDLKTELHPSLFRG